VLDDVDAGQGGGACATGEVELADGDHGRILPRLQGAQGGVFGLLRFAGEVYSRDIDRRRARMMAATVPALELSALRRAQEPAAAANRLETILRPEQRVAFSETGSLRFDVGAVVGIVPRDLVPVEAEVSPDPVVSLQLQVRLLDLLQQSGEIPEAGEGLSTPPTRLWSVSSPLHPRQHLWLLRYQSGGDR
jgi:hypothetical protein